jgi:hypothetical protein
LTPNLQKTDRILDVSEKAHTFEPLKKVEPEPMSFSFFSKKTNESTNKEQSDNTKKNLDDIQGSVQVLEKDEMIRVEGGKSGSKQFDQVFTWNSSCGGTIPQ